MESRHPLVSSERGLVDILDPNPRVVDALMRLSLPAGVSIEIKS